jgi:hypothetical protein
MLVKAEPNLVLKDPLPSLREERKKERKKERNHGERGKKSGKNLNHTRDEAEAVGRID